MNLLDRFYYKFGSNEKRIHLLRKSGVHIGTGCDIACNVSFGSEPYLVSIGNNVRITHGVLFITHDGGCWVVRNYDPSYKNVDLISPITVGNNVHIGIGSIIMPGVHIGNNVIIGCGAVVTRDIPDNSVAAGIPCRVIRSIDDYIHKHKPDFLETKSLRGTQKKDFLIKKYEK